MKKLEQLPPNPWLESLKNWEKQLKIIIQQQKHSPTLGDNSLHPEQIPATPENAPTTPANAKLHISASHNSPQYYLSTGKNKKGKYLSKKEINKIQEIAQQEYNTKVQKALEKEHHQIEKFLAAYQKQNATLVYQKLPAPRRALITPLTLPDQNYARDWQQIEYHHKPFTAGTPQFYTQKGERVRSKSEILIANTLTQYNIPYRYEYPVRLQNYTVHPDFICLNLRTRQEYLWEHLGRLDDTEYLSQNLHKLQQYEKSGYFPGHHLILTFETAALPLNVKQIKNAIKEYLM